VCLLTVVTMLAYNKFGQDLELTHIRLAFVTSICVVAALLYLLYQAIQQSRDEQPVEVEVKAAGKYGDASLVAILQQTASAVHVL